MIHHCTHFLCFHISFTTSCIKCQLLWFSKDLKISNTFFQFKNFSKQNIKFINHLFNRLLTLKAQSVIMRNFKVSNKLHYKWIQFCIWHLVNRKAYFYIILLIVLIYTLIIKLLTKLSLKELYLILVWNKSNIPISQR